MTKESLADLLTGREVGEEISKEESIQAQRAGLVVVFGASDDLIEFRGVIDDEAYPLSAEPEGVVKIDAEGLLPDRDQIDDDDQLEKFFIRRRGKTVEIKANWCPSGESTEYSWTYTTDVPHATFEIMEGDQHYCRGIVFDMPKSAARHNQKTNDHQIK